MHSEKLSDILFFSLEKSIKSYRQFAQKNITGAGIDITIDQWLVLKTLKDQPDIAQHALAVTIFKDMASITRMIELLVRKKYLHRAFHATDRRRSQLSITAAGEKVLTEVQPIIELNRKIALAGISADGIRNLRSMLQTIIANVQA